MQTTTIAIPHGVVFLYDPTMVIDVPPDTGQAPLLATPNCISIWTVGEDDGETTLMLGTERRAFAGSLIFEGELETEGKQLAFNDSGCGTLLCMDVPGSSTWVRVYSNHPQYPTTICCIAEIAEVVASRTKSRV